MRAAPFLIIALALLAAAFLGFRNAGADELPRGLGHDDITHKWVGSECCTGKDCEVIPFEAVTQVAGGYSVAYISARGFTARGFVRREHVKVSRDPKGRPVGCASRNNEGGPYMGQVPGNLICLYFNETM